MLHHVLSASRARHSSFPHISRKRHTDDQFEQQHQQLPLANFQQRTTADDALDVLLAQEYILPVLVVDFELIVVDLLRDVVVPGEERSPDRRSVALQCCVDGATGGAEVAEITII